jgi:hypothetical protein
MVAPLPSGDPFAAHSQVKHGDHYFVDLDVLAVLVPELTQKRSPCPVTATEQKER